MRIREYTTMNNNKFYILHVLVVRCQYLKVPIVEARDDM